MRNCTATANRGKLQTTYSVIRDSNQGEKINHSYPGVLRVKYDEIKQKIRDIGFTYITQGKINERSMSRKEHILAKVIFSSAGEIISFLRSQ